MRGDGFVSPGDGVEAYMSDLQQFKLQRKARGPQKSPTKVPVNIRLSPEVIEHFRATGDGWQTRIDEALLRTVKRERRKAA